MPEPTARQSHIDVGLTNISIAYRNANYVWDQVFPQIPVQKISNKFFSFPKAAWFRDETAVRAPGTKAKRADYTIDSTGLYVCVEKALSKVVPDEVQDNSDAPLRPLVTATEYVSDQLLKAAEIDVTGLVFGTGWSSSATPSTLWSSPASTPVEDVETAREAVAKLIGREPNVGVIGRGLWRHLKQHPDILDRMKYTGTDANPAAITTNAIAGLFELDKFLVARALQDTGAEGAAASLDFIGGKHLWLGFVPNGAALEIPAAGYTFTYMGRQVNRFRDEEAHSTIIECRMSWDAKITAPDAGYLIKSAA